MAGQQGEGGSIREREEKGGYASPLPSVVTGVKIVGKHSPMEKEGNKLNISPFGAQHPEIVWNAQRNTRSCVRIHATKLRHVISFSILCKMLRNAGRINAQHNAVAGLLKHHAENGTVKGTR
jgi:hypothetical protein